MQTFFAGRLSAFSLLLGVAIALGGCGEGGGQSAQTIKFGESDALEIQPIQVCDDNGDNCAKVNLFEDITAKILAQAKLKVSFLPVNRLNASRFLSVNDSKNRSSSSYEFYELTRTGEAGAFGRNPRSTDTTGPVNVWFVDTIEAFNGFTQYGLAWVDANGVLISRETVEFGSQGRTDTVAHEIGHNLGLRHSTLGAGGAENLLTDGDRRNIPNSILDVYPNGARTSQLTNAQIKTIRESSLLGRSSGGGSGPAVIETDEQRLLTRLADVAIASNLPANSLVAMPAGSQNRSQTAKATTASVPEPGLGLLGFSVLGLGVLGIARSAAKASSSSL